MPISKKSFSSSGGFAVNETTIIDDTRNVSAVNTLEIKNNNFSDATRKEYILKGTNTSILSLNNATSYINLSSNTINFITAKIIGVNNSGNTHYSLKIESVASCDSSGDVLVLSELRTIIEDSVPLEQTWAVSFYDSATINLFSYSVSRSGTTDTVKWIAHVDVVSVLWSW